MIFHPLTYTEIIFWEQGGIDIYQFNIVLQDFKHNFPNTEQSLQFAFKEL